VFTAHVIEKDDPVGDLDRSPFSCPADFAMATDRATALGASGRAPSRWPGRYGCSQCRKPAAGSAWADCIGETG
jgi:hypothetical protein